MVLGIDKGTTYTKTDKGLCIRSTVKRHAQDDIVLRADKTIIEYQKQTYIIGENGSYATDLQKSQHQNTKLLILTAIAKSTEEQNVIAEIVTGLPIGQYTAQKDEMKKMIKGMHELTINSRKKIIKVLNAEVFPEAAGAFYSQSKHEDALIIDIGGLSIDTALFIQKKLTKYSTYAMGIMKLYSKMANKLNSQYDLSLTEWDIENILKQGLYINGKQVEVRLDAIIKQHIREIIERLTLEYDIKTQKNIILVGGPAEWLKEWFDIPQLITLQNSQFANAKGYGEIGRRLYQ